MTHLFVVVLVKKTPRRNVKKEVSRLLEPYDEQLQVPEYEETCYCVGSGAHHRAYEAMRSKFGTIETREAQEFGKQTFESDPERTTPERECRSCSGIGKRKTTYNPNGKWDWWSLGGRWDRMVNDDFSKANPYDISHTHQLEGNVSTPRFLIDHHIIPYAIVTPDGHWHEEEDWKGWEWKDTVRSILSENLDTQVVGVDCHA